VVVEGIAVAITVAVFRHELGWPFNGVSRARWRLILIVEGAAT